MKNGFTRIALAGDSAGGSLATSLALDAIHEGLPAPIAVCTNSLWADIAMNTPSLDDPIKNKHDIRKEMVIQLNKAFLMPGGIDPMGPRHSPVYRDLHGLPPLLLQAAGLDICHDDSVRLAANAKAAGVKVKYTEYPNCDHIWILNGPCKIRYADDYPVGPCEFYVAGDEPKEAEEAIDEMVAWIRENDRR